MLQMPHGGIWGNPFGFVEQAMQVQNIYGATCERHEKREASASLFTSAWRPLPPVAVKLCIPLKAAMTDFFQPHRNPVSVFRPAASFSHL